MILTEIDCWPYMISYFTERLATSNKSGFCDSFSQILCKPWVVLWCHNLVMALLYWYLHGWVSHDGLANVLHLQFGMLWAQARSLRSPNWIPGFQSFLYSTLYSYIKPTFTSPPSTLLLPPALTRKVAQNSLNFGCLKVTHSHNYG